MPILAEPEFDIGEWRQFNNSYWQSDPYLFSTEIDSLSICNGFIESHVNKIETPFRLIDSYRSYLIQSIKDVDYQVSALLKGRNQFEQQITYSIDSSITKAQPWRFTCYLQKYINSQMSEEIIHNIDPCRVWPIVESMLEQAFENGALFRIEKYIKVAHVLMDISFDIGWDSIYSKASSLKHIEGLTTNPERAATLREISLFIGRNFWSRNFFEAAEQIIYIGFPDIPHVVGNIEKGELERILTKMNSKEAVQTLFSAQMAHSSKSTSCNQIVEGALRIIGGRRTV